MRVLRINGIPGARTTVFIGLVLIFLTLSVGLGAHPLLSLTSCFVFVWEGERLSGGYLEWTFDQFFSGDIIQAYDANADKKLSAAEQKLVYQKAFINIENYHFFTFIRQGDKRTNPKSVKEFSAWIKGDVLVYRFFVDLSAYQGEELYFANYDYTFFFAIPYAESEPVKLRYDPELVDASYEVVENKKYPVYYNPMGAADDTTVYYSWKKGLLTFYPKEIHVKFAKKAPLENAVP